jgi:hypothetical protein
MNISLLQNQSEDFEKNELFNSYFVSNDRNSFFQNDNNDNFNPSFLKEETINESNLFQNHLSLFEKPNILHQNNDNLISIYKKDINNDDKTLKNEMNNQFNTINNFNDECSSNLNISPISMLTTSNSNKIYNLGVKKNEKENEEIFKCDFLESISLGLDENDYFSINNNKKKNKIDLNNPTSLLAAIINLMKEKGPIEIKTIISCLESKKDTFRKANGSRYKQDFGKLIRTTLNTPDIFYKIEENKDNNGNNYNNPKGSKYFFIEDKTAYYLQKKRERDINKMLSNLKKKNTFLLPINTKIQLDKVNIIIKKLEKKYKGDKKYINVMFCIDMFKSLIEKYLFLVKMDKINSLYELSALNDKIIDICHTLEKMEKGELFFPSNENIIIKKKNEYNYQNHKNIMFVEGQNNHFNEPPNKI